MSETQKLEEIFSHAIVLQDPGERREYVRLACDGDVELENRISSLLASAERAGSFLELPRRRDESPNSAPQRLVDANRAALQREFPFLSAPIESNDLGSLGPYRILNRVGRGGMGIVFRAFDPKLQRIVAIKALAPKIAVDPMARKRFEREARSTAAVSHPHVVVIHAVEEAHNPPYLVMEFVQGKTLADKLAAQGALSVKEILRIGAQIADGLAAAHQQGLVHRDMKPANILLENGVERAKITDFGLAKAADDIPMTRTGDSPGTPQFMSPEQASGGLIDHRSDLFSMGAILYAMCTGRPPFRAENLLATMKSVCEDTPRPIQQFNPDIPDWMAAFVNRMLAKFPVDRYQTAAEVATLLHKHLALIQAGPIIAPSPVGPNSIFSWNRRQSMIGVVFASLMIAIGVYSIVIFRAHAVRNIPIVQSRNADAPLAETLPQTVPASHKNSLGMEFAMIPKGQSWLGGGGGMPGNEKVEFKKDFYLGRYEVTQEEWQMVTASNPSIFKAVTGIPIEDQIRFPVDNVSWEDIQSFLKLLNSRIQETGWVYRLPKQAEWEYACRGGPMSDSVNGEFDFYFEKPVSQLQFNQANFLRMGRTCKVGSYTANQLGLYDMHGNVWEWCDEPFDANDPVRSKFRMLRGGSWRGDAERCRAGVRDNVHPQSRQDSNLGFRLARVPVN